MGFIKFLKSLLGDKASRDMKAITPIVEKIKAVYPEIEKLSNDELRQRITDIRAKIKENVAPQRNEIAKLKAEIEQLEYDKREPVWAQIDKIEKEILDRTEDILNEVLPEVFAIVKDTARRFAQNETIEVTATEFDRELAAQGKDFLSIEGDKAIYRNHWMAGGNEVKWDMIHYDVQLIGGIVLHQGKIAEMATGEGKTLVATLPVFLNALPGNGVHVVTVNDYLAKRDSEWMGPIYMFHGLSVDCIDKTTPNSPERRRAYNCDITFGTNNEFGFDYLRDNMAMSPRDLVQRSHNYAIVDEVDSVLIDDARTPLIISGPVPKGNDQMFEEYKTNVERVVNAQRKLVTDLLADAKKLIDSNNEEKVKEGALLLYRAYKGLPKYQPLIKFLSQDGVKQLMLKVEAQYMQDNSREMHIVTDPLYFIIDEKNNSVQLTDKGIDVLTGTTPDPTFFVLPDIATDLSQVENEPLTDEQKVAKKDELMQNYAVKAERVHTVNQLLKAYTLFTRDVEYIVSEDNKVKIVDEQTGRIMEGRRYSDGLHQAIEAKEGVKVEEATQTFATITLQNYFRMYHKLAGMTGTAETEAAEFWDIYKLDVVTIPTNKPVQRIDMPDRLYRTKKEKYNAVIEEIEKMIKQGRPVLVGTTSVEVSELLSRMLTMRHIQHNVLNAKLHQREAEIVRNAGQKAVVTIATNMAGRGTDIKLSPEVRDAGGLAIIGTERHESRRVDRQLRGRSGRQGDKGSSVFFVSFEDTVMRLFAGDKVAKLLDRMGLKEGEAIESNMLSSAVENAQKRVEENNFGIRKHLLEYDDVMNTQRNVIYTRRHHAVMGERIGLDIINMIKENIELLVKEYSAQSDYPELRMKVMSTYAIETPFTEQEFAKMEPSDMVNKIYDAAIANFNRKSERIAEIIYPYIKAMVEQIGEEKVKGLVRQVPISDGRRILGIPANIEEAYKTEGKSVAKAWQKAVLLMTIDEAWKEHLRDLDQLRQSVQNASYEQKDPLLIYKIESFNLFASMLNNLNTKAISLLMRGFVPLQPYAQHIQQQQQQQQAAASTTNATPQMPGNVSVSGNFPLQMQQMRNADRGRQQYTESKEAYPGADAQRRAAGQPQGAQQRRHTPIVKTGPKVGRNDPCPCGSGKKYKDCHGRS